MRIEDILGIWAKWNQSSPQKLGYPSKCVLIASGGITCWDDVSEQNDQWVCGETESAINDLDPGQRQAIHHKWLGAKYTGPMEFAYALESAIDNLIIRLRKKNILVEITDIKINTHRSSSS